MDVADVDELKRCLTTDGGSRGGRLGRGERDIVRGHSREGAEAEERVAEQSRGVRADGHFSQVLGKDRPLEANSTRTDIRIIGLNPGSAEALTL
jgi:hypothetical protein